MSTAYRTYEVYIITDNGRRYDQALRAFLETHVQKGGTLPPGIAVPRGYGAKARQVLGHLPGGDCVDVEEIGGCLTREVWFLVEEESPDT